jgi:thioredoxin-dependent peroxiredoxin
MIARKPAGLRRFSTGGRKISESARAEPAPAALDPAGKLGHISADRKETPMAQNLKEGGKAPAFKLPTDNDGEVSLKELAGKTVVLYFYPKDDTSGCTKEAIGFTEKAKEFARAGAVVIGVSKDSPAKHDRFKQKHRLDLVLASDEDGTVIERYGAWVEKSLYGRKYMGVDRSTILIDKAGVIRQIWRKVKVPGHVEAVLAAAKAL